MRGYRSPSSQKPIAQRTLHGRLRGLTAQRLSDATQARPSAAASRSTNSLPARRTLEPMLWTGWRRTGPFFSSHPAHTARGCDLLLRRGAARLCVDGLLCRMATSDVGGAESAVTAAGRCSSGTPTARTCPIEPVPAPQRRVPSARARHRTRRGGLRDERPPNPGSRLASRTARWRPALARSCYRCFGCLRP